MKTIGEVIDYIDGKLAILEKEINELEDRDAEVTEEDTELRYREGEYSGLAMVKSMLLAVERERTVQNG